MIRWEYVTLGSNKGTIRMIREGFAYKEATDKGVDGSHQGDSLTWA